MRSCNYSPGRTTTLDVFKYTNQQRLSTLLAVELQHWMYLNAASAAESASQAGRTTTLDVFKYRYDIPVLYKRLRRTTTLDVFK